MTPNLVPVPPAMMFRAKHLMPHSGLLIDNGAIVIGGSQILDIGEYQTVSKAYSGQIRDLGESVIMPGFINAHTHLDLTHHANLIANTANFTDWLLELIANKNLTQQEVNLAIKDGIAMSLEGGATSVGDIRSIGMSSKVHESSPIRSVLFFETTGFSVERSQFGRNRINEYLTASPSRTLLFTPGISPHAPYSTSQALYKYCGELARRHQLPLCTHLAETREECEFLLSGTGKFTELLESLGIPIKSWIPPKCSPVEYLRHLGILTRRPLLAHCNYLQERDIPIIRENAASIAFCPRTHHLFKHAPHPIEHLIESGINVAIGTDSLASNWSLSMLDELKFLAKTHNRISPDTMIELATANGAKALHLKQTGKLRSGWQADLIALSIPNDIRKVAEQILDSQSRNILTVVSGKVCYVAS